MTVKLWADFNDWLLPELPGVPGDLVRLHLRSVAIDFLDRTGVYVVTLDPITLTEDEPTYDLDAPTGYEVARILEMKMGEGRILPRSLDQLRNMYLNWSTVAGPPQYYLQETSDSFRLVPYPDQAFEDEVEPRVVLRPTRESTGIEDWIYDDYVEVIVAGVKARLMAMPQKPWTNLIQAAAYDREYRAGRAAATVDGSRSLTRVSLQVAMRRV